MSWLFGGLDSSLRSSNLGNLQSSKRASSIRDPDLRWTERALPDPKVSRYFHLELCGEEDRLQETWSLPTILLQSSANNSSSSNTSNMSQYSFSSPMPSSPLRASMRGGGGMHDFGDEEEDEEEDELEFDDDDMELDDDSERIPSPPPVPATTTTRRRFA
ncbi:hypothetical protein BASA81_012915 [Batrachochytrium salamandrivorans]|nr:hypothetical protein BASA81_012915 [Batrachochytrium salamandrivorans]